MPIGWGDTYFQSVAGQSFDITNLPNGTYYVEVIANPLRVLHETTTSNDISLRKVILGGTKGHRTVRVPAWHGIDPENGNPTGPVILPRTARQPGTTAARLPRHPAAAPPRAGNSLMTPVTAAGMTP